MTHRSAVAIEILAVLMMAYSPTTVAASTAPVASTTVATSADVPNFNGAAIRHITIDNFNVFDPSVPEEDKWLYRTANNIHVTTRKSVIEHQLLIAPGDVYSQGVVDESERLLRSNRYIKNASIQAVDVGNGEVDVNVTTNDVWTLTPSVSLGRTGGSNNAGFAVKESNLLGTGVFVGARYQSSVDRNIASFEASDRNLFGSRIASMIEYGVGSDGYSRALNLSQPFYALDSRASAGLNYQAGKQVDSLYDLGQISDQFEHRYTRLDLSLGRSGGLKEGWARRWSAGLTLDQHEFNQTDIEMPDPGALPDDRNFLFPWLAYESIEDDFETETNVQLINQIEDRQFGTRYRIQAGRSSEAWHLETALQNGIRFSESTTIALSGGVSARLHNDGGQNVLGNISADLFHHQSPHRQLYLGIRSSLGYRLDGDNPVVLGGDTGLRGYPLRYQSGDKNALLTIEQRFFTDWYPYHLFHVGGALFFDAGRTWGNNAAGSQSIGWLKNVGMGLRLGNDRSSSGKVLHMDLAFPLDGGDNISNVQILFQAKSSF